MAVSVALTAFLPVWSVSLPARAETETAAGAEDVDVPEADITTVEDWEHLEQFLLAYEAEGLKEYDYRTADTDGTNLMTCLVSAQACVSYWDTVGGAHKQAYPGDLPEEHTAEMDPRGWTQSRWWSHYVRFDVETENWIAKHIFNLSDAQIEALVREAEMAGIFYQLDDSYYAAIGGGSKDNRFLKFLDIQERDGYYYLQYGHYRTIDGEDGAPAHFYGDAHAVVKRKVIDGKGYWSLYVRSASPIDFEAVIADAEAAADAETEIEPETEPGTEPGAESGVEPGTGPERAEPQVLTDCVEKIVRGAAGIN